MIKCIKKRDGTLRVHSKGSAHDMALETLVIIMKLYQGIKEENPELAEMYKKNIIGVTLDPNSPVWKED